MKDVQVYNYRFKAGFKDKHGYWNTDNIRRSDGSILIYFEGSPKVINTYKFEFGSIHMLSRKEALDKIKGTKGFNLVEEGSTFTDTDIRDMKKSAIGFKPSFNFIALAIPQEMYPKSSAVLQKKEVWKQGVEQNLGGRLSEKLTVAVIGDKVEDIKVDDVVLLNGGCRVQLVELDPISEELVLISDGNKVSCPQIYLIVRETDILGKFD